MLPTQARGEAITPDMAYIHATPQGFPLYFTCSASQCSYVGCVASNDSFRLHRHRLRNRSCCQHDESFRPPSHRRIEFDTSRVGPNPAQVIQPSSLLTLSMAFGRRSGHTREHASFSPSHYSSSPPWNVERASFHFTLTKTCSGPGTPSCHAKFAALDSGHFSQFSCKQLVIGFLFLADARRHIPATIVLGDQRSLSGHRVPIRPWCFILPFKYPSWRHPGKSPGPRRNVPRCSLPSGSQMSWLDHEGPTLIWSGLEECGTRHDQTTTLSNYWRRSLARAYWASAATSGLTRNAILRWR